MERKRRFQVTGGLGGVHFDAGGVANELVPPKEVKQ